LLSHDVRVNVFARYFNAFRTLHVCAILCAMTSLLYAADPVVSNISAVQRAGTKLVDVADEVMATHFVFNAATFFLCPIETI
jgi:hypothetical protein